MAYMVYGQSYDYRWYGPQSFERARDAQRCAQQIAATAIGRRQCSGAVLYAGGSEDPERVAVVIPAHLRPGAHESDVEAWLDAEGE
jgi:hypothetical protein